MTKRKDTETTVQPMLTAASPSSTRSKPEWADGLRHLYQSVVNEPLPDSFADLLSKLDKPGK